MIVVHAVPSLLIIRLGYYLYDVISKPSGSILAGTIIGSCTVTGFVAIGPIVFVIVLVSLGWKDIPEFTLDRLILEEQARLYTASAGAGTLLGWIIGVTAYLSVRILRLF